MIVYAFGDRGHGDVVLPGNPVIIFGFIAPEKEVLFGNTHPGDDAVVDQRTIEGMANTFNFIGMNFGNFLMVPGFPDEAFFVFLIDHGAVQQPEFLVF